IRYLPCRREQLLAAEIDDIVGARTADTDLQRMYEKARAEPIGGEDEKRDMRHDKAMQPHAQPEQDRGETRKPDDDAGAFTVEITDRDQKFIVGQRKTSSGCPEQFGYPDVDERIEGEQRAEDDDPEYGDVLDFCGRNRLIVFPARSAGSDAGCNGMFVAHEYRPDPVL